MPLGNEAPADGTPLLGLGNELGADGWARIPYGEWPHAQGLQRFGRPEAEAMVGYYKQIWNRIKRAIVGLPIFRGHPDLAAVANEYPDKAVYGQIADLEARDDGLYVRPVLSAQGAALVNEEGLAFFSPHWLAKKLPDENGRPVFAPQFLVSIGLTSRPNIAGTSLVNSQPTTIMKLPAWLLALLGLANEATDEQVKTKVTDLLARPESTALANEQTSRTAAETALATAKAALATAETALANERAAHAATAQARNAALVDAAIRTGRVLEAARPVWLGRLERDFATESTALANEQPGTALKVTARTAGLAAAKPAAAAAQQFHALVNERTAKGEAFESAWHAVKATEPGKALFQKMSEAAAA